MKVWLDDTRPPPDETWHWVKHPDDLIRVILYGRSIVEEISFDHDLGILEDRYGRGELTGYSALCAIEELVVHNLIRKPEKMYIHSANAGARKKMELAIQSIERL